VVTPIFLMWGWRAAFLFTGGIGLAWIILWSFVSRRPDVRHFKPAQPGSRLPSPPGWTDRACGASSSLTAGRTPLGFVMYAASLYLSQVMGKDRLSLERCYGFHRSAGKSLLFLGWLVDRMTAAGIPKMTTVRRLMLSAMFLSLPLAAVPGCRRLGRCCWNCSRHVRDCGFVVPSVAYATHVYAADHAGLIAGIGAGSYGAIVALTMPLFGKLFDMRRYGIAFAIAALMPALGYLGWAWINRSGLSSERSNAS